jgi:hypothetical protein
MHRRVLRRAALPHLAANPDARRKRQRRLHLRLPTVGVDHRVTTHRRHRGGDHVRVREHLEHALRRRRETPFTFDHRHEVAKANA